MIKKNIKTAILLQSDLQNDARVIRQANAAAEVGDITVFYVATYTQRPAALSGHVEIICVPYPKNRWQTIKKHMYIQREYDFLWKFIALHGIKYHKVIANDLPTLRSAIMLKKKGLCQSLVYDAHEIYTETIKQFFPGQAEMSLLKRGIVKILTQLMVSFGTYYEKKALKQVDAMMTVNESLAGFFARKYKIKKPSVVRSIPATPLRKVQPVDLRKNFQWPGNSIILLYQGALNPGRGIGTSIEALSHLPDNYKMVIIGDGPLKSSFEEMTEAMRLTDRIKFIGQVPNNQLASYTQGADIGLCLIEPINLSKQFSLPNKIFEYIHAGIPVLGSDLPEIRQIISQYRCGEASSFDVNELVVQIKKTHKNSYRDGIQEAQKALKWENEKQKLLSILNH